MKPTRILPAVALPAVALPTVAVLALATLATLAVLAAVPRPAAAQTATDVAGPLLTRALTDPDGPGRRDDGAYVVWVWLADRGRDAATLRQDLAARRAELPARTLARRARMLPPGAPAVDARDLPVAPRTGRPWRPPASRCATSRAG